MRRSRLWSVLMCVAVTGASGLVAAVPATAATTDVLLPPSSGSWQVEGRGYGHGIGMSQWGAQAAALAGLSADQILDFYYPGTQRYDIGQDYPLRVLLSAAGGSTVTLAPDGADVITAVDQTTGAAATLPAGAQLRVQRSGGTTTVTSLLAGQSTPVTGGSGKVFAGPLVVTTTQAQLWVVAPSGTAIRYPGSIVLNPSGSDALQVVNSVPMEQYLRGVVPRESPASWSAAALQAQAVAARTYALAVRNAAPTYDICDTTACQVYGGSASRSAAGAVTQLFAASTDAAVLATARIARYYGGGPAFTQFSSSNGGFSKAGSAPYLVAKADPYTGKAPGDTVSRWTGTLTVARVQQSCPSGGSLQSLTLHRDGNGDLGGRILSADLKCTTGTSTVNTPAFGLLSNWWAVNSGAVPFGSIDGASAGPGPDLAGPVVNLSGWAADNDQPLDPLAVDALVDGAVADRATADSARPDVALAFPWMGAAHGYGMQLRVTPGSHQVCVQVHDLPSGNPVVLGCRTLVAPGGALRGNVDWVSAAAGAATVSGWAFDPGSSAPVNVVVTAQGQQPVVVTADGGRPDVAAAFPGYGAAHGYQITVPATADTHWVCVELANPVTGSSLLLGCPAVHVPPPSPIGALENVAGEPGSIAVSGWAFDPDVTTPTFVWVDVDGRGSPLLANVPRNDIAARYGLANAAHGFQTTIAAAAGSHVVCVTAVNAGPGSDTPLGCRTVTVPGGSPFGSIDYLVAVPGGVTMAGWALDPDVAAPPFVWVDIDGAGHYVLANGQRPDVSAVHPGYGTALGWTDYVGLPAGAHRVCITVNNVGAGKNTELGCAILQVKPVAG